MVSVMSVVLVEVSSSSVVSTSVELATTIDIRSSGDTWHSTWESSGWHISHIGKTSWNTGSTWSSSGREVEVLSELIEHLHELHTHLVELRV